MSNFILYSYFRSSASYRVRLALHFKKVDFDYRGVHLVKEGGQQLKPDFLKLNPLGQVPLLIHGNVKISQSMAIIQYLDEIHPSPSLIPDNPAEKAKAIEYAELVNSGIQPLQNLIVTNELNRRFNVEKPAQTEWIQFWIERGFSALEKNLNESSKDYCLGSNFSIADCFLIPQIYSALRNNIDLKKFPNINRIHENTQKLDFVKKSIPENQPDCDV